YTLDFHALRMRAVELAATLTPRESICSRKAATAAAGRASSALRTAAPIQRALWQRIVSSSIGLNRPQSTWMGEGLRYALRLVQTVRQLFARCSKDHRCPSYNPTLLPEPIRSQDLRPLGLALARGKRHALASKAQAEHARRDGAHRPKAQQRAEQARRARRIARGSERARNDNALDEDLQGLGEPRRQLAPFLDLREHVATGNLARPERRPER